MCRAVEGVQAQVPLAREAQERPASGQSGAASTTKAAGGEEEDQSVMDLDEVKDELSYQVVALFISIGGASFGIDSRVSLEGELCSKCSAVPGTVGVGVGVLG